MSCRPSFAILALALLATTIACDDDDDDFDRFQATLSGAAEIPPRQTNATGTFSLTDRGGSMQFALNVSNGTNITAAHIHTGDATVASGGILVNLFTGPTVATVNGALASGTFSASDIRILTGATAAISMDSLRALMRTGNAYVNVHSTTFPAGEIRGQISRR